jgi:hypothetical protein
MTLLEGLLGFGSWGGGEWYGEFLLDGVTHYVYLGEAIFTGGGCGVVLRLGKVI